MSNSGRSGSDPPPASNDTPAGDLAKERLGPEAGSLRAIVAEFVEQRVRPYWCCVPFGIALVVTAIAGLSAPADLSNDATHRDWAHVFETSALVVGALAVGLVVEVREPFARAGEAAIRIATVGTAGLLAAAGISAIVALIPSLPNWLYEVLFGLTLGGLVGGIVAVMAIGISTSLRTLDEVDQRITKRLETLGDR